MNNSFEILDPIISRSRRDGYAVKRLGQKPACKRKYFTDEHIKQHLEGRESYGVYPIAAGSSETSVALFDMDSHKGELPWEEMIKVAKALCVKLQERGVHATPWRSSGGHGIHLYMIWDKPQDAYSVRELLNDVLKSINFKNGTKGVAESEIEIFPKQSEVAEGRMGSMFILPLAGQSVPIDKNDWSQIGRAHV